MVYLPSEKQMHTYYTPNLGKLQAFLAIFTLFVNYDNFYVNTIMLTAVTGVLKLG